MDRYLVISSDCHAGLPPEQYRDYLDPQYRERFDVELAAMQKQLAMAGQLLEMAAESAAWREGKRHGLEGAWDHARRIEVLDADGIAGEIIFPDGLTEANSPPFGAGLGLPTEGVDPELQWAGARSHNRWLAEFVQLAPERRVGVAPVPALWDVDEAVKEVRWARANGLSGIMLPHLWGSLSPYHHPKYDPLWAACEELDVVIHFHSGAAPMQDYFGTDVFGTTASGNPSNSMPGALGIYVCEVAWWLARPILFMIWGGVFERFPTLKVAVTEGSSIWVPEMVNLMDQRWGEHHFTAKLGTGYRENVKLAPSEYFRRNVKIGSSCMSRREAELRREIGVSTIMWGTDYPHPEGSWPTTQQMMIDTFRNIPEDEIAAMLGANAAAFYGFDTEKLAPLVERIGPQKSLFRD